MVILDYETVSSLVNLKEAGAWNYIHAPDFKVLCSAKKTVKSFLDKYIKNIVVAHNAGFEAEISQDNSATYICTAVMSRMLCGPSKLASATHYWQMSEHKDPRGEDLIKWFIKNRDVTTEDYRENLQAIKEYCVQDVKIEYILFNKLIYLLKKYTTLEQFITETVYYNDTLKINTNGLPLDIEYCIKLKQLKDKLLAEHNKRFLDNYNVNPRSPKQVLQWLNTNVDFTIESTNRAYLRMIGPYLNDKVKRFIFYRDEINSPIYKKVDKLLTTCSLKHARLYNAYVHYGTYTGRYTSYGANVMNMPRIKKLEHKGKTLEHVKQSLKSCICASSGNKLLVIDYKQIEFRVLMYTLEEFKLLDKLIKGFDLYVYFAERLYQKKDIHKEERYISKQILLSSAYGAGVPRLQSLVGPIAPIEVVRRGLALFIEMFPGINSLWESYAVICRSGKPLYLRNGTARFLKSLQNYVKRLSSKQVGAAMCSIYNQSTVREIMTEKKHILLSEGYKVIGETHDEVKIELSNKDLKETTHIIKLMEQPVEWLPKMILQTEHTLANNWSTPMVDLQ